MEEKSPRFAALHYRDFRLMWFGQMVSMAGSQMQIVALNWHIYVLTHSAVALGLIGLARVIPIIIFSILGGSFADAFNRKKLMLFTQSFLTLFSLILGILTFTHHINATLIYLLTALSASMLAFDTPARQAILPNLVDRKHLTSAMSLNVIMWQTASIVGPALAGFLIGQFDVGSIYALNALSFLAVIIALLLIHADGHITGEKVEISLASVKEGIKFVTSRTLIWSTMLLDFFSTFFASATALLPIFAQEVLHVGPQGLGILYAAPSIGALLAGFIMAHVGNIKRQGKILLWAVSAYALGTILFGISKNFLFSLIGLLIIGAGDSISTIIRNTIRQLTTPDSIRGRMTAINMIFFMGGPQLGEFEAGLLAAAIGAPLSVVVGGVGTLIVIGIIAAKITVLRNYDTHESLS